VTKLSYFPTIEVKILATARKILFDFPSFNLYQAIWDWSKLNNLKRSLTLSKQASKKFTEIPACEAQLPAAKKLHPDEASNFPPLSSPAKKHQRFRVSDYSLSKKDIEPPFMKAALLVGATDPWKTRVFHFWSPEELVLV